MRGTQEIEKHQIHVILIPEIQEIFRKEDKKNLNEQLSPPILIPIPRKQRAKNKKLKASKKLSPISNSQLLTVPRHRRHQHTQHQHQHHHHHQHFHTTHISNNLHIRPDPIHRRRPARHRLHRRPDSRLPAQRQRHPQRRRHLARPGHQDDRLSDIDGGLCGDECRV